MGFRSESDAADNPRGEPAGAELLAAIRAELADERVRAASLESRALTLSAAAAGATALIFGLGSDYAGRWKTAFFILLGLAGLAFLSSSVLAWSVARLRQYDQPDLDEYQRLIKDGWEEDIDSLRLYIADGSMSALQSARGINDRKAVFFERALFVLLVGVIVVGAELMIVVLDSILT